MSECKDLFKWDLRFVVEVTKFVFSLLLDLVKAIKCQFKNLFHDLEFVLSFEQTPEKCEVFELKQVGWVKVLVKFQTHIQKCK